MKQVPVPRFLAQFSYEQSSSYNNGFALSPNNAILNFTITGLAASTSVNVSLTSIAYTYNITGTVTTDASGNAKFAAGIRYDYNKLQLFSLTVAGNPITLVSSDKEVAKGKIYNIARNAIPGALIGVFTINEDGDQVYFSKGNLQATTTDGGTNWTWAFAEHQWDYIGGRSYGGSEPQTGNNFINGNKSVSENGTVDLFGWSTSATYLGIHKSRENSDYSDGFFNWGLHADVITGIGSDWCTLTKDEWLYLFYTRSASTVGTSENARYTEATINTDGTGVNGVILFPDGATFAAGEATWGTINAPSAWGTKCTTAQWTALEAKGCVFLPAAGYRDEADVEDAGDRGYYWSSTANGGAEAYYVYFVESDEPDDLPEVTYTSRYNGHSVRLVRPVQ